MIKTPLCELLDIEFPILQGGMAWISDAQLAAAVSNAGGLGIIAGGNAEGEIIRKEIQEAKKLTDQPFGVNIMLLSPFVDEVALVVAEEKVAVVTTGAGNPGKYIEDLKKIGTKVIPVIPSVSLAKRMEREGVDAVIAEGTESGGHIGESTTMSLVPQVVDAVSIPVIAAGGIADGRGLVAALALGASGVQIGTRFVCSEECTVHYNYKMAIVKAGDRDAVATGRLTGHPVRCIKNKLTREFEKLENSGASSQELEQLGVGRLRAAVVDGDVNMGSVMAGQIAGMVKDIKTCEEIIKEIIEMAEKVTGNIKSIF